MKKNVFDIKGMSCSACSAAVQRAMDKENGITKAEVNLLTNSMSVIYDEKIISADDIISAVKNAGYDASLQTKIPADCNHAAISKETKQRYIKNILVLWKYNWAL